ncbi:PET domain protein [Dictyocaulus viviparus]|uniref:PET domain protein n=1 Tax=Dictyocaulus viviparus TaxID=29172 RepID=A0A0D8XF43_DICVI|nr:PET domain protein [Dictyocaulus viviparus]
MDEHDVQLPNQCDHGQIIIASESLKCRPIGEQPSSLNSSTSSDVSQKIGIYRDTSFAEDRTIPTAAYNFKLESNKDKTTTEYSWVPVPDKSLVERYMRALPVEERPIVGSVGEQNRKSRLQFQLPLYDCNVEDARFADDKDKEVLRRFVENVRKHVIGVGQVKEITKEFARLNTNEVNDIRNDITGTVSKSVLIFAREYTFAEEKSWHFDHFACFKCDFRLGGHRYMTKNDQPHCIDCYMKYFAKSCNTCGHKIGADEKRLNYQEYHWHAKKECFQLV